MASSRCDHPSAPSCREQLPRRQGRQQQGLNACLRRESAHLWTSVGIYGRRRGAVDRPACAKLVGLSKQALADGELMGCAHCMPSAFSGGPCREKGRKSKICRVWLAAFAAHALPACPRGAGGRRTCRPHSAHAVILSAAAAAHLHPHQRDQRNNCRHLVLGSGFD